MLLTKVFLSAARCDSDNCTYLALTQDERYKLVEKLDDFGRETSVWGAKPGQSTLEACIATIREVLEDPLYLSLTQ
jgi:hypothetical protein